MNEEDARLLAFRFMASTTLTAPAVWIWLRRLLGHRPRRHERPVPWSEVLGLLTVLLTESEVLAVQVRRRVEAAEAESARRRPVTTKRVA